MKRALTVIGCGLLIVLVSHVPCAQQPQLPPNYPPGQYDESKVPKYTLPDLLVMLNGKKVSDTRTWREKRRPEILKLFATCVYGRTMAGRPKEMTWEVTSAEKKAADGLAVAKTVTLYFAGKKDGPKMDVFISLPAKAHGPFPVFLMPSGFDRVPSQVLSHGYGFVRFDPSTVEPDNINGYAKSIRAFFAKPGQMEPEPDEWGAIGAWAWAASRALDYLMADPGIDAKNVFLIGVSRFGKVAMWAGAQDERFAIVFSVESGCGGANIVRRQYGETVKSITGFAPYWFDRNFKDYADRVNDLPVDWHMLIAVMAPRPVYIATAEQDYWGDPRGSFLAAKAAEPVYELFGRTGLGVAEMPGVETPVGDMIGYHNRKGTHGINDYDWLQFLKFADRHFRIPGGSSGHGAVRCRREERHLVDVCWRGCHSPKCLRAKGSATYSPGSEAGLL